MLPSGGTDQLARLSGKCFSAAINTLSDTAMFYYTLGFIFTQTSLITPLEFSITLLVLYLFLYLTAPLLDEDWKSIPVADSLKMMVFDAWYGEIALWRSFWPFFIALNITLFTADTLIKMALISVSSWDNILMMVFIPSIMWCISIWRASANTGSRIWAAMARLASLSPFVDIALRIYLQIDYPRPFFNCGEMLFNFRNCF